MSCEESNSEGTKATRTAVHRYGGSWARDGHWEFTIHEYEHETFVALAADFEEARGIRWLVSMQMAQLVSHKISEGFEIISADTSSAYLRRRS